MNKLMLKLINQRVKESEPKYNTEFIKGSGKSEVVNGPL
jgi:hypothetical protein